MYFCLLIVNKLSRPINIRVGLNGSLNFSEYFMNKEFLLGGSYYVLKGRYFKEFLYS